MTVDEYVKVVEAVLRPNEKIANVITDGSTNKGGIRINTLAIHDGKEIAFLWLTTHDNPEKFLCFLLERLPEWEDFEGFLKYLGLYKISNKHAWLIPIQYLTSPSILPEKVGEYIEWRDKK